MGTGPAWERAVCNLAAADGDARNQFWQQFREGHCRGETLGRQSEVRSVFGRP
jgi:hypothetical protein